MTEEIWKPVLEGNRFYVSNLGRVKNADGHFMKVYSRPDANPSVRLNIGGRVYSFVIDKLVEYHFPKDPENRMTKKELNSNIFLNKLEKLKEREFFEREEALRNGMYPEEWETIYDTWYEVSNYGNVRNGKRPWKNLKPTYTENGARVTIRSPENKYKIYNVAKLVADHFIRNPKRLKYVTHKDGNRLNNHVDNLQWDVHHKQRKFYQ